MTRPPTHEVVVARKPSPKSCWIQARARGEADEERPDRQQDQERLEAVERPCQADHDRDDSDEDLFEHAVHPPMQPGQLPAVG